VCQQDDVDERVRFLEAGADDVIARPFDPRELEARVEGLLIRFQRSRDLTPLMAGTMPLAGRRRVIACFSPKGGVGTTTIAVNIAVTLAQHFPEQVGIVDLDVDFGQVATHLNVKPRLTIADLAADDVAIRDGETMRSYADKAQPGLYIFAAPGTPERGRTITPTQVEHLLASAPATFQALVVDAGSMLDERSLVVLDRAEAVIIPIVPEIGALKALHGLLEYLTEEGTVPAKSTFVLNHLFGRDMLSMKQIESAIAARVDAELPYDPALYLKAINEGIPVVRGAAASAPARALTRLALAAAGVEDGADAARDERRGGLFSGLRRRG
jgi:pilus assembly protein CpaE